MSSETSERLYRQDLLDGLIGGHGRVATTLLYAIESRTGHLVSQSRQVMARWLTEEATEQRDLDFLQALAQGRDPPTRVRIQDLEKFAPEWAQMVPDSPQIRAAIVHLLAQQYQFASRTVPGIRTALGLDAKAVREAYQQLYRVPLDSIYVGRMSLVSRWRWMSAALARWFESLPSFWTAFALTLTETVGAGILALPIAVAGIGPLPGVVILAVLGLVNVLTIAYMAEAVSRSNSMRYGSAFLGRFVADYLGPLAASILLVGLTLECALTLWPFYIGFGTTLSDAIEIVPASAWAALLFLVNLFFLGRETLNATVSSALVIGAVNITLILVLAGLALTKLQPVNLGYANVPLLGGRPFEPSLLELIFGVGLLAYFGHLSVSNCARVVLRRDPDARSLIWGGVAAQMVVMVIYCLWVVAVNGAVAPQELAGAPGTALGPLAAVVGTVVHLLGPIFVILGMGIGSLHSALPLYNLVRERLPTREWRVVLLPRRRGKLILYRSGQDRGLRLGLTYLDLIEPRPEEGGAQPRFRMEASLDGRAHSVECTVPQRWDGSDLSGWLHGLRGCDVRLAVEILEANRSYLRLRISSTLRIKYEGEWVYRGLGVADLFDLPEPHRKLVTWVLRRAVVGEDTVSLKDAMDETRQPETMVRLMLDTLVAQGFLHRVRRAGDMRYGPGLQARRGRRLQDKAVGRLIRGDLGPAEGAGSGAKAWAMRILLSRQGRFALSVAPVALVFALAEWLLLRGSESFAEPLGFLGVIVISLLGGMFPVLLLAASRRKGEIVPGVVCRVVGHPVIAVLVYLVFLANLFVHGLVVWQSPVERAAALGVGLLMIGSTAVMVRQGVFRARVAVLVRDEVAQDGRASYSILGRGRPLAAEVRLGYAGGESRAQTSAAGEIPSFRSLQTIQVSVPAGGMGELKVWAQRILPDGSEEALPARLRLSDGAHDEEIELQSLGGSVVLPLDGGICDFTLLFAGS